MHELRAFSVRYGTRHSFSSRSTSRSVSMYVPGRSPILVVLFQPRDVWVGERVRRAQHASQRQV